MKRILITGGNGRLGRVLVSQLSSHKEYTTRVMSRSVRPVELPSDIEWAQADLETGQGLDQATDGVQTILHAASSPRKHTRQIDVEGTRRLVEQAERAGVSHIIYVSIVGIDQIHYAYYESKLAAEQIIENGKVPWSILRATQFHYLLDLRLRNLSRQPVFFYQTDLPFQPISMQDVAAELIRCISSGPSGRLPDMGGPEVLDGYTILNTWLDVRGLKPKIIHVRLPGKTAEGFRRGLHTTPQNKRGKLTWREWLEQKYS